MLLSLALAASSTYQHEPKTPSDYEAANETTVQKTPFISPYKTIHDLTVCFVVRCVVVSD